MKRELTGDAERALHDRDHAAWLAYVVPHMVMRINELTDTELNSTWGRMPREYQEAVWDRLDNPQRARVRGAREGRRAA